MSSYLISVKKNTEDKNNILFPPRRDKLP